MIFFHYNILSFPSFIGSPWISGSYYFLVALNQYQDFFVFELFLGVKSPDFFLITISLSLSDLYNLFALPCMFILEISVYQFTQKAKSMRGCRIFLYFYHDGGGGGPRDNYIVWGRGKSETYFWLFDYVNLINLNFQGWNVGGGGQDPLDPRPLDSHSRKIE